MPKRAEGSFEVKLTPISTENDAIPRMSIDKQYRGALTAKGQGQMITSGVEEHGSRVYVALETVTGALDGYHGSFILAHRGTMTRHSQELSVLVVPDSGTGELIGLSGEMTIHVSDGKHAYSLTYDL